MEQANLFLIKNQSAVAACDADKQMKKSSRSLIRRILIKVNFMKTSAFNKDGEITEKDEWNYGLIIAVALLYVTVIGGIVTVVVFGALYYLDIREDMRTGDAWRMKQVYDGYKQAKTNCEENAMRLNALIKQSQQNGQKVPAELLQVKDCGTEIKLDK